VPVSVANNTNNGTTASLLLLLLALMVVPLRGGDGFSAASADPLPEAEPAPVPSDEPEPGWPREAQAALDLIEVPAGFEKRLVAAEPLVRDPVAFGIDAQGRAYVCESARQENGVEDNRSSHYWLLDDLALQTVDDRMAMYEKYKDRRQGGMDYYSANDDRLTRLVDTDGDGILDARNLFTPKYEAPLDGTLAGVLVEDGKAWITNIPHLWLATDADDDGVAEQHVSLQRGFGIRVAFRGHDMHGLVRGPDGRIYWSIGDRGYHLTTADGRLLADPGSGAVFRCEPDGSDLEVVHVGLRNPQELAIDDRGDLFTGDNNSDAGDKARLVQIVWGGETGWRMEYQSLEGANRRGPWDQEGIWQLDHPVRPVWALAPIAHLTSGPSGFVHYPGTGLPEENRDSFFLCDFRGSPGNSSVWRFRLEQDGAGFQLADSQVFVNKVLCTDVDFTPDGKMWISAWGGGWGSTDRGRLMEVWHPESQAQSQQHRVGHWLTTDLQQLPSSQLGQLLAHPDRRVRQRVQFHLAGGDRNSVAMLLDVALNGEGLRERRHGIWGVGQWARVEGMGSSEEVKSLSRLCDDEDAAVREQVARVLGDLRGGPISPLIRLLDDPAPRVKFHAALAIGRIGVPEAVERLMEMAAIDGPLDPLLRHAAVMGLAGSAKPQDLMNYATSDNREVRLAVLLALRKKHHPGFLFAHPVGDGGRKSPGVHPVISMFLADEDAQIATEAARAIHDLYVLDAMPALADRVLLHSGAPDGALKTMLGIADKKQLVAAKKKIEEALTILDATARELVVGEPEQVSPGSSTLDVIAFSGQMPPFCVEVADGGQRDWPWVEAPEVAPEGIDQVIRQEAPAGQIRQVYFEKSLHPHVVAEGDTYHIDVRILEVPKSMCFQVRVDDETVWEHRAYWGVTTFPQGTDGEPSLLRHGDLPATGEWVQLQVDASKIGIEVGKTVLGIAMTQTGGKIEWGGVRRKSSRPTERADLWSYRAFVDRWSENPSDLFEAPIRAALVATRSDNTEKNSDVVDLEIWWKKQLSPVGRRVLKPQQQVYDQLLQEKNAIKGRGDHRLPYLRRVIDAALRHGDTRHAAALVSLAGRDDIPSKAGRLAIEAVLNWVEPGPRDLVRGTIRPYGGPSRSSEAIRSEISAPLLDLIQKGNHLAGVAQQVASVHGIDLPLSVNETILADASQQTSFRIQALRQIVEHHPEHAGIALGRARSAGIAALRVEAERFEEDQSVRVQKLKQLTTDANEMEIRQLAIRAIGAEKETSAIALLTAWLDALEKDDLEAELHLDVLIAASMSDSEQLKNRAARIQEGEGIDRVADHRWALAGGNFDRGRNIFLDHPVAQCQRCHSLRGNGGVAGPALDGIGARQSRDQILRSLVDPSAILAEGYETETGISAMPEIHWTLKADEIRDLLEFVCGDAD